MVHLSSITDSLALNESLNLFNLSFSIYKTRVLDLMSSFTQCVFVGSVLQMQRKTRAEVLSAHMEFTANVERGRTLFKSWHRSLRVPSKGNLGDVEEEGARRELQRFPLEGSDVETEIWWKKSEPGGGGEEEFSR